MICKIPPEIMKIVSKKNLRIIWYVNIWNTTGWRVLKKIIEQVWTMVNPQPFRTVAKWLISAPQQSLWIKPTGCIVIWQTLPKQTFITCNVLLVLVRMLLTTGTSERVEDLQLSASFRRQSRDWKGPKCLVEKTETMKSETKVFPHVLSLMDWHEWYNQRKW